MCLVNIFFVFYVIECLMCNEVIEYVGMLFKIIVCYLGDIYVK